MNEQEWKDLDHLFLAKGLMRNMTEDPEVDKAGTAQVVQTAVQIAIAEQMATQNEHLACIRESLSEIATVLLNAAGAGGSINVNVVGQ